MWIQGGWKKGEGIAIEHTKGVSTIGFSPVSLLYGRFSRILSCCAVIARFHNVLKYL